MLAKHVRRRLLIPDFESDCGVFFDPARLPELRKAIADNRARNCGTSPRPLTTLKFMSALFTEKELQRYSITRALNQIIQSQSNQPPGHPGELSGVEREVHDALKEHYSSPWGPVVGSTGVLVPLRCLTALHATTGTQAGIFLGSSLPSSMRPEL